VIFPAGSVSGGMRPISVPITNDMLDELNETFMLTLSAPGRRVVGHAGEPHVWTTTCRPP
jgi:hypothetical protein